MPKEKLLIVEDEASLRWVLREWLRDQGYESLEAGSAAAARALFEEANPAAVLLDINLPDGSGLELLREFKQRRPALIAIMITADLTVENAVAALRGGASDFLGKPLNHQELQFILQREFARRPKPAAVTRPQLLLYADSRERCQSLRASFDRLPVEIAGATTSAELNRALESSHDLAIVDAAPARLRDVLEKLRASAKHTAIPVLVRNGRLVKEPSLVGVLPQFRAMPCSDSELIALAQRRLTALTGRWQSPQPL